jgi:thiamine transporter
MRFSVKLIAEIGMMLALSIVLGLFVMYRPPQGGAVTAAMLPLFVLAIRRGPLIGIIGGILAGTLQMALDPFFVHPVQVMLDYQLAWGAIGLAGFLKSWPIIAVILGSIGRFVFHCLSGYVFFAQYAPEGAQAGIGLVAYVAAYNAAYIVPSVIIALVIILVLNKTGLLKSV